MTTTTLTLTHPHPHPLDALPIGERDRAFLRDLLDMLTDEPVSEYDFPEVCMTPHGRKMYRQWEGARLAPLVRYADRRPAKTLEDFGWFDPIPSRRQVEDALEAAAHAWKEELL